MEINIATTPRQTQPTSFPFLFVVALLFYFFSKSPSVPDGQARVELERALDRRRQEVVGLKHWLNSSVEVDPSWSRLIDGSNFTELPVTPSLCYLQNQTYGVRSPQEGQRFVSDWLAAIDLRVKINTPRLFWKNITGHIRGEWSVRDETLDWYPSPSVPITINPGTPATNTTADGKNGAAVAASNSSVTLESRRGKFPWISKHGNRTLQRSRKNKFWPSYSPQKIGFNLKESRQDLMRSNSSIIRGTMYISAADSRDVNLDVEGVHFQDKGTFYLHAWPSGIYFDTRLHLSSALDIPGSYYNDRQNFNNSIMNPLQPTVDQRRIGEVMIADLLERARRIQAMLKKGDIAHESEEHDSETAPNCTFLIYGSLVPLPVTPAQTAESLLEYESSLSNPTGASVPAPNPSLPVFQSLMISPTCGLVLETSEMTVLLSPQFWAKGKKYGYIAGLVMGTQCLLLVWQMDGRQSPSSLSRISYLSLVIQIIMDAWTFSSHLTLSVVTNNLSSQALLIPAFFACLNAILFGMRYGTLIRIYAPVTTPQSVGPNNTAGDTIGHDTDYVQVPTADNELPTPTDGPAIESQPVNQSPSIFRRLVNLIRNFFVGRPLISVALITMTLFALPFLLYRWQPLILFILYSYWIPQIFHNVRHGTSRRGLRKRYVAGTTLCRLFLPLYIWGCPTNVLFVDPNPWIWLLCIYSIIQATFLILQDWLGARFFLVAACSPYEPIWDYHPITLPRLNSDLEDGSKVDEGREKLPECVICFEPIDVLPVSPTISNHGDGSTTSGGGGGGGSSSSSRFGRKKKEVGIFSRWSYMVPPCNHIAHTKCLENWLAIKSECPVCRRTLPPI